MKNIYFISLILIGLFTYALPKNLMASDAVIIDNIEVDEPGTSSVEARNKAIKSAERKAFYIITDALTKKANSEIPEPNSEQLAQMIKSYEVRSEKISPKRYKGIFKVSFSLSKVTGFLTFNNIEFENKKTENIVILPVLRSQNKTLMWADENPWRAEFEKLQSSYILNPFILPSGDIKDVQTIKESDIAEENKEALSNLAAKYKVKTAVLAELTPLENGENEIKIFSNDSLFPEITIKNYPEEFDLRKLSEEAFLLVKENLEQKLDHKAQKQTIEVSIYAKTINEWLLIKDKLEKIFPGKDFQIKSVAKGEIIADISFEGDVAALEKKIFEAGLSLSLVNQEYVINLTSGN